MRDTLRAGPDQRTPPTRGARHRPPAPMPLPRLPQLTHAARPHPAYRHGPSHARLRVHARQDPETGFSVYVSRAHGTPATSVGILRLHQPMHERDGTPWSGARFQTRSPSETTPYPRSLSNLEYRPMSDCSLHVGKLMVPRPLCSTAMTLTTIYDETEPQQGLHAP